MSEMVERVARAIHGTSVMVAGWDHLSRAERDSYFAAARAAIEARRELPDDQAHMLLRTFNLFEDNLHLNAAREWHRRMTDEALK